MLARTNRNLLDWTGKSLLLRCNKQSAYTRRPTLPFVDEEFLFLNTNKDLGHRTTVLARTNNNLTHRLTAFQGQWSYLLVVREAFTFSQCSIA
jgi:hypothetical protein